MADKEQPYGLHCLLNKNKLDDIILGKPYIRGIRISVFWSQIQGSVENFDQANWYDIDYAVDLCAAAGKKIGIGISAGINTPAWVYEAGAYKLDIHESGNLEGDPFEPLPWDLIFQEKWRNFLNVMGARYDSNPTVEYIIQGGYMQKHEMPFTKNDEDTIAANAVARDGAVGYDLRTFSDIAPNTYRGKQVPSDGEPGFAVVDALLTASREIMTMFATAFPTTAATMTQSQTPFLGELAPSMVWATWTRSRMVDDVIAISSRGGVQASSRYAELPDFYTWPETGHLFPINMSAYPHGDQMIYSTKHDVDGRTCYTGVDITYGDGITLGTSLNADSLADDDPANSEDIGLSVTGAAIAPGTTIAAIAGPTEFTLSQPALTNGSNQVFTVHGRLAPTSEQNFGGTWPQWKSVRDQCESAIYRGSKHIELYYTDITSTKPDVINQLIFEANKLEELYGTPDPPPPPPEFLPQGIIMGGVENEIPTGGFDLDQSER